MLTDRPPRDPARLAAFLASDRCGTLELPPDDRLRTPALALEAALPHGTSTAVRDACVAFLIVAATLEAGARRLIAQSIAWVYAPGLEPHAEEDPLDLDAAGTAAITARGVVALEQAVLTAPTLEGIVLRYGWLYGPGTGTGGAAGPPPLHIDA